MQDHKMLTVDEEKVINEARKTLETLIDRIF
jgi:hypothetical protein